MYVAPLPIRAYVSVQASCSPCDHGLRARGTDHLKMPLLLSVVRSFVAGQSKMSFQPDTCRGSTGD